MGRGAEKEEGCESMNYPKHQFFNGIKFTRDERTGYYLNSTIRKRMHRYVWEFYNGTIPKGYEIHHKDRNKANNSISNLEIMQKGKHSSLHCSETVNNDLERTKENLDRIRPLTKEWHSSEEGRKWHEEHYQKTRESFCQTRSFVCEQCGKPFNSTQVKSRFCSNTCKAKWRRSKGLDNEKRICIICGKEFETNKFKKQKTCSRSCGNKLRGRTLRC